MDEAVRLGVKEVVITECGHAYRVAKLFYEAWEGKKMPFKVTHVLEVIDRFIKEGKITVEKRITDRITYHDPCQIARNGGIFDEPRDILKAISTDFVEMYPNREKQWCCGGGGGIVALEEFNEMRVKSGGEKTRQLRETGAKTLACPCENCRLQIDELNKVHDLGLRIVPVMELVVESMVLPGRDGRPADD